jgi:hypothetical protein
MDYGFFIENHPADMSFVPAPQLNEGDNLFEQKSRMLEQLELLK